MVSSRRLAVWAAAGLLAFGATRAGAQFIDPPLPGSGTSEAWTGLNSLNYPGFGSFPGGGPWPGGIGSNGPVSDAVLTRVAGGADGGGPFLAFESIYFGSFQQVANRLGGTLRVSDANPHPGVRTVALQIQIGEAVGHDFVSPTGSPKLAVNGSTNELAPLHTQLIDRYQSGTFFSPETLQEEPVYVNTWGFQWLVDGAVTSFQIDFSAVTHAQVYALRLDQSDGALLRNAFLPDFRLAGRGLPFFDGADTTVTHTFTADPASMVEVDYTGNLGTGPWTVTGPHPTGTGTFNVTITQPGDHVAAWSRQMFFRARFALPE